MKHRFYGVRIDEPLSAAHGTDGWESSVIGKLNKLSKGQIYIREIPRLSRLQAAYGWRVVDARLSQEDGLISRFAAYDLQGKLLPGATFGVHWDQIEHYIRGGFGHLPEYGNAYYVPGGGGFVTSETGGYTVQVLDLDWPAEGLSFGHVQTGEAHHAINVAFRLFKL